MINNAQISPALEPKVALVTGGAVRLGRTVSLAFAKAGYSVAVHYNKSEESAAHLSGELRSLGVLYTLVQSDFLRPGSAAQTVEKAVETLGRLDVLVNSAAILLDDEADTVDLARMKLLNVDAPLACLSAAIPHLEKVNGCVVNIADVAGAAEYKKHKFYSRTKSALIEMTRNKALEVLGKGVRINAVCPSTVLPPKTWGADRIAKIASRIPMGRIGRSEEVADAVLYLAGASFVTGQILFVDGGVSLAAQKKRR